MSTQEEQDYFATHILPKIQAKGRGEPMPEIHLSEEEMQRPFFRLLKRDMSFGRKLESK
jgi:hypothetical protein